MAGGNINEEGLWIQTGNPFTVSEATPFVGGQLGKVSSFPNSNAENGITTNPAQIEVQYVKRYASDTVASVAGDLAFWQDTDNFVVTGEPANAVGGTTAPIPAGVFGGSSPAAGSYGFVQVSGVGPVRVSDSTSAGTVGWVLVWSTNRQVKHVVAGTQTNQNNLPFVGVLRTLNTATGTNLSVEAVLTVPRLGW